MIGAPESAELRHIETADRSGFLLWAVTITGLVACSLAVAAYGQEEAEDYAALLAAAVEEPWSESAVEALLAVLPKDEEFYVLDGDLLMTATEVRRHLLRMSIEAEEMADPAEIKWSAEAELIGHIYQGRPNLWPVDKRVLSYSVDRATFPQASQAQDVVERMAVATGDWESACPGCLLDFVYAEDDHGGDVTFEVRWHDSGGRYYAAAFFPHHPRNRRKLRIDPSFFAEDTYDLTGILRHELGHILGYLHEHTRKRIRGCRRSGKRWVSLTPEYDPLSVMHSPCEGNTGNPELELSPGDIAGHQRRYSAGESDGDDN